MPPFLVLLFSLFSILNVTKSNQFHEHSTPHTVSRNAQLQQSLLSADIDLIDKEIMMTEKIIKLYSEKILLLKQTYLKASPHDKLLSSSKFMNEVLCEDNILSLVENQLVKTFQQIESRTQKEAYVSLNSKQLANKISKKSSFSIQEEVKDTFFLNSFAYKTQQGNTQSFMVVVQLANSTLLFYDLQGNQIVDPYTPEHQVHLISLIPRADEVIISTLGTNGIVEIVKLENKKIRVNDPDEDNEFVFKRYVGVDDILVEDEKQRYKNQSEYKFQPKPNGLIQEASAISNVQPSQDDETKEEIVQNQQNREYQLKASQNMDKLVPKAVNQNKTEPRVNNNTARINQFRQTKLKKVEKFKFGLKSEGQFKLQEDELKVTKFITYIKWNDGNLLFQEMNYTSFMHINFKGAKIFLIGDSSGNIHTYFRNGTLIGTVKASNSPILHLAKGFPNPLFSTKNKIGQINPMSQEITSFACEEISEGIIEIQYDQVSNNHLYVLTEKQEVILIEVKISDNSCKLKQKLHRASQNINNKYQEGISHSIVPIKNSLLLWDLNKGNARVFNTSNLLNQENEQFEPFDIDIYKMDSNYSHHLTVKSQKQSTVSTLLMVHDQFNSASLISLFEVTIPQVSDSDFLNNIRTPILIVVALIFIGYQYCKRDGEQQQQKTTVSKSESKSSQKFDPIQKSIDKRESSLKKSIQQYSAQPKTSALKSSLATPNQKSNTRVKFQEKIQDLNEVKYRHNQYY